jgi:hypothetical protein
VCVYVCESLLGAYIVGTPLRTQETHFTATFFCDTMNEFALCTHHPQKFVWNQKRFAPVEPMHTCFLYICQCSVAFLSHKYVPASWPVVLHTLSFGWRKLLLMRKFSGMLWANSYTDINQKKYEGGEPSFWSIRAARRYALVNRRGRMWMERENLLRYSKCLANFNLWESPKPDDVN